LLAVNKLLASARWLIISLLMPPFSAVYRTRAGPQLCLACDRKFGYTLCITEESVPGVDDERIRALLKEACHGAVKKGDGAGGEFCGGQKGGNFGRTSWFGSNGRTIAAHAGSLVKIRWQPIEAIRLSLGNPQDHA
jgi:hypothetical protein